MLDLGEGQSYLKRDWYLSWNLECGFLFESLIKIWDHRSLVDIHTQTIVNCWKQNFLILSFFALFLNRFIYKHMCMCVCLCVCIHKHILLLTLLCTDVGHHCNKMNFFSKVFIKKIFKYYVYGGNKEKNNLVL